MKLVKLTPYSPSADRPLRQHARLLLLVAKPQFGRLPERAQREVERELRARRAEGRAA
jgi:hypothetical protein